MMEEKNLKAKFLLQHNDFTLDVDLQIPGTGVTAIFGPSGSGKTTLLRCLAGLEQSERGELEVKGDTWQSKEVFLPTHKRPLGYVFQESSLFPHLTARKNLHYALKRSGSGGGGMKLDQATTLLGIDQLLDRYPHQLSGGERQRVAIARALLIQPQLLLMDEPLASLDLALKQEILPYLERVCSELSIPILYVSHSADEIARLADHLVVLDKGRVVASGPLAETLANVDLPIRLGEDLGVVVQGQISEHSAQWNLTRVSIPGGDLWLPGCELSSGQGVRLRMLAKDLSLATEKNDHSSILNLLHGQVSQITPDKNHDGLMLVRVQVGPTTLIARITRRSASHLGIVPKQSVWVQVKSAALVQ